MLDILLFSIILCGLILAVSVLCIKSSDSTNSLILTITSVAFVFLLANVYLCALVSRISESWLNAFQLPYQQMSGLMTLRSPLSWISGGISNLQLAFLTSAGITAIVFLIFISSKPAPIYTQASLSLFFIIGAGVLFIMTDSLLVMLICFELLLLASLYLLRLTSKSERVIEASVEMLIWTLVGSAALLIFFCGVALQGHYQLSQNLTTPLTTSQMMLILVGFGVKIPVWPFVSWLLKAHVEASVEFSILLSGFIVKVGVFGLYRFVQISSNHATPLILFGLCAVGLISAVSRLFGQRDLKRIVALTTVIEMNWLGLCLACGNYVFEQIAVYLVVAHSLTTSLEFSAVEFISRRYGSRDVGQVQGLLHSAPNLGVFCLIIALITIGFPGTPLFFAKLIFFATLTPLSFCWSLMIGVVLLLIIPAFFIRLWTPIIFGSDINTPRSVIDLSASDLLLFSALIFAAILLTFYPASLLHL